MTTFHTLILDCPHCKEKMLTYEMMSYYVNSSIVYSDGAVDCSPAVLPDSRILICPECSKAFWKDDSVYKCDSANDQDADLPYAKGVHDLPFALQTGFNIALAKYYSGLLDQGFADTVEMEVYIRIEIWKSLNNFERYKTSPQFINLLKGKFRLFLHSIKSNRQKIIDQKNASPLFESNLEKLIEIFIPEHDADLLLLAEMHRELGEFSTAQKLLNKIENCEEFPIFTKIKTAAERKQTKIVCIKSE